MTPAAEAQLTAVLAEALVGHAPVLEIGVGTGRIALPLAEAGAVGRPVRFRRYVALRR